MRSEIENSTIDQLRYRLECSLRAIKKEDEQIVSQTMVRITEEDTARFWSFVSDNNPGAAADFLNEVFARPIKK